MDKIDKDMLNRLGGPGSNRQRGQSPANTWRDDYRIPGISDLRLRRLSQHELSSERNDTRIRTQVDNHLKTNTLATLNISDRHTTQPIDTINGNGNGLTQQWTPIATSQEHRAPISLVSSRNMHVGSGSTMRVPIQSLPASLIPPKAYGHSRSHHSTQSTFQRMQRVTDDRQALGHHRRDNSPPSSQVSPGMNIQRGRAIVGQPTRSKQNGICFINMTQRHGKILTEDPRNESKNTCNWCTQDFKKSYDFIFHADDSIKLQCKINNCMKKFCKKEAFERHLWRDHCQTAHYCALCLTEGRYEVLNDPSEAKSHYETVHGVKKF